MSRYTKAFIYVLLQLIAGFLGITIFYFLIGVVKHFGGDRGEFIFTLMVVFVSFFYLVKRRYNKEV